MQEMTNRDAYRRLKKLSRYGAKRQKKAIREFMKLEITDIDALRLAKGVNPKRPRR